MTRRKIAVIGSGVSGMTAGYILSHIDYVTLFEADGRLGGHADTHMVVPPTGPPIGVDTGFIVYNERTYPLLTRMFAELGVATQAWRDEHVGPLRRLRPAVRGPARPGRPDSRAPPGPRALPADARRDTAVPPRRAPPAGRRRSGDRGGNLTLGQFLADGGFSGYFTAHFALPLVAAVWSCPPGTALSYPARYLFAFLANHGMLAVTGSPPWRTVTGGSRSYVERAAKRLHDVRLCSPVRAVRRHRDGAEVRDAADQTHQFDAVVIATHPDQALRLLDPPTQAERDVLGAFGYTQESGHASHRRQATPGPPGHQGVVELRAWRLPPMRAARRPGSATT